MVEVYMFEEFKEFLEYLEFELDDILEFKEHYQNLEKPLINFKNFVDFRYDKKFKGVGNE